VGEAQFYEKAQLAVSTWFDQKSTENLRDEDLSFFVETKSKLLPGCLQGFRCDERFDTIMVEEKVDTNYKKGLFDSSNYKSLSEDPERKFELPVCAPLEQKDLHEAMANVKALPALDQHRKHVDGQVKRKTKAGELKIFRDVGNTIPKTESRIFWLFEDTLHFGTVIKVWKQKVFVHWDFQDPTEDTVEKEECAVFKETEADPLSDKKMEDDRQDGG